MAAVEEEAMAAAAAATQPSCRGEGAAAQQEGEKEPCAPSSSAPTWEEEEAELEEELELEEECEHLGASDKLGQLPEPAEETSATLVAPSEAGSAAASASSSSSSSGSAPSAATAAQLQGDRVPPGTAASAGAAAVPVCGDVPPPAAARKRLRGKAAKAGAAAQPSERKLGEGQTELTPEKAKGAASSSVEKLRKTPTSGTARRTARAMDRALLHPPPGGAPSPCAACSPAPGGMVLLSQLCGPLTAPHPTLPNEQPRISLPLSLAVPSRCWRHSTWHPTLQVD